MAAFEVTIGGHRYTIAGTDLLPKGKRAYARRLKALQDADPGMPRKAVWQLSGPIGQSRQRADGFLGHDYGQLETRYDDLLTSPGAVTTMSLTGSDPLSTGSAALGAMVLGSRALGGGTALASPSAITHIRESKRQLFIARGAFISQVNPATWGVVATTFLGAAIRGMEEWLMKLRIGLGGTKALQSVGGVSTTAAATFADTQVSATDVLAKELGVGQGKLWMVRADPAGTNENRIRYTADDFTSISSGFPIGDPGVPATAISRHGYTMTVGNEKGLSGFTDEGYTVDLISALKDARSANNARKKAVGPDGWEYVCTDLGLYAVKGQTANPVGIGSDAMSGFEGFDGRPVAVMMWRESLFVVYEDSAASTWRGLEGRFNPNLTPGSGELDWYPLFTRTNAVVREIAGATRDATGSLPAIVWGEGSATLARISKGRTSTDRLDTSYPYSVAGGYWYGSALMARPHVRKTIRWGRFNCEDMGASGNSWTLAISFDGGSYANIGSSVTTSGAAKVVPATPTSAPTGFVPKPRLTQVAGGAAAATTPPKIRGTLEIGYDERPDHVTECVFVMPVTDIELARLRALLDADSTDSRQPVEIRLPDDSTLRYGYVTAVDETDLTDAAVKGATVTTLLYDAA